MDMHSLYRLSFELVLIWTCMNYQYLYGLVSTTFGLVCIAIFAIFALGLLWIECDANCDIWNDRDIWCNIYELPVILIWLESEIFVIKQKKGIWKLILPCATIFCRVPWQGTRQSCHSSPCACPRGTRQRWHCLPCAWPCGTRQTAHVACWVDGVTLFCRGPDKTHGNGFAVCPKNTLYADRALPCAVYRV